MSHQVRERLKTLRRVYGLHRRRMQQWPPRQSHPLAIAPHDAKRMLCREAFTDLTCQDRTVDRGNDGSVKVDGDCFRRKFVHELVFITQDGSAFLLQLLLLKLTPEVVLEWIGVNGGIDFPTGRERPSPEIFVLNIVEKPR